MDFPELYYEDVRRELSEIDADILSDEVIVQELIYANEILEPFEPTDDEELMIKCIVLLAAYMSYVSYSIVADRRSGTAAKITQDRARELKFKAYLMCRRIAPINKDLIIDVTNGGAVPPPYADLTYTHLSE